MSPLAVSCVVFACIAGAGLLAMALARALPEHHLKPDSKEAIKYGMALIATLTALTPSLHDAITERTTRLVRGLRETAARHGVPFTADCAGSMWGFFFRAEPVRTFAEAKTSDVERFKRFFHAALDRGVYLAPSAFEAAFLSAAHSDQDIDETLDRLDDAMGRSE